MMKVIHNQEYFYMETAKDNKQISKQKNRRETVFTERVVATMKNKCLETGEFVEKNKILERMTKLFHSM